MTICVNCGVELDDVSDGCPLCGWNPEKNKATENISLNNPSEIVQIHRKENRKYLWELAGIITFSGIVVCTIVDLILNRKLTWSLYSDVSQLAVWLILTLLMYTYKRPWIIIPGLIAIVLAALFLIDLFDPGPKWFFAVALPVTIAAFTAAGILTGLYKFARFQGLNLIASAFIVISGFCILTEMILDRSIDHAVNLRWSLIAAVSMLPFSLIFFFYHYRLKKGNRLDSFFHI
jgi:hypothetical protein